MNATGDFLISAILAYFDSSLGDSSIGTLTGHLIPFGASVVLSAAAWMFVSRLSESVNIGPGDKRYRVLMCVFLCSAGATLYFAIDLFRYLVGTYE